MDRGKAIAVLSNGVEYDVARLRKWMGELQSKDTISAQDLRQGIVDGYEYSAYEALKSLGAVVEPVSSIHQWGTINHHILERVADNVSAHILAVRSMGRVEASRPSELAWTLPQDLLVETDLHRQSLAALIRYTVSLASNSLFILSPFLDASGVEVVAGPLAGASHRGVETYLITHDLEDITSSNYSALQVLRAVAPSLRAFTVPQSALAKRYFLLHAKLVVADAEAAVLSSANLTQYGMRSHLEVGVGVYGGAAFALQRLLDVLIQSNYVVEVQS